MDGSVTPGVSNRILCRVQGSDAYPAVIGECVILFWYQCFICFDEDLIHIGNRNVNY